MNTKNIVVLASLTAIIASSIFLLKKREQAPSDPSILTIGILQTASHPALDATRQGFEQALRKELGDKVNFIVRNAQGSVANTHTIAQSFAANNSIASIFAIATPAAQAIAAVETSKPLFIAAVSDPQAAGLLRPGGNVCGSSDMVDPAILIDIVQQLLPTAHTIGLLSSAGEPNSQVQVARLTKTLQERGLVPVATAVSSEADVPAATTALCQKVDAIILPNDNVMSSSIQLIASLALKNNKPLIASDNMLVTYGALAARGVDYHASGAQAAHYAYEVLVNNKKPSELPVAQPTMGPLMINKKTAAALNIPLPIVHNDQIMIVE